MRQYLVSLYKNGDRSSYFTHAEYKLLVDVFKIDISKNSRFSCEAHIDAANAHLVTKFLLTNTNDYYDRLVFTEEFK